jgi:apolipoprotein N-acyltransferase
MNKKHLILSILTGLLLAFSYPNFLEKGLKIHTFFFIWFAYMPLLFVMLEARTKKALFFYGVISGSVFYLTDFYWLCNIKPMGAGAYVAWAVLGIYMALFIAAGLVLARVLKNRFNIDYLLSLPSAYTIMEFCREWVFSGFQLLTPAQSQHQFLPILQMLKITGVYGPAFLILFVNMLAVKLVVEKKFNIKNSSEITAVSLAGLLLVFAVVSNFGPAGSDRIRAAILQPDIDQDVEWSQAFKDASMKTLKEMIFSLRKDKPGLIVWPETAYPGILNIEPWRGKELASLLPGSCHLVGSDSYERKADGTNYYNSAFMVDDKGTITGSYDKYHLVPFGEYIPLQNTFNLIKKVVRRYGYTGFTPGKKIEPLDYRGIKFGVVICYDSLFPEISREFAKKGAKFLTHLSYETWYGRTPCTSQIFLNTAMRSIENGIPMIRCVASGISGFIDSKGEIYSTTGLYKKQAVVNEILVDLKGQKTIYTRFGDWFPFFLVLLLLSSALMNRIDKNDSPGN